MNIPKLRKQPTIKSCHGISWEDDFSWVHQENILEDLKDGSKLLPDVKKYLTGWLQRSQRRYFKDSKCMA